MLRIRPKNLHQATFQTQMPFVECFAFAQRAFGLGLLLFVCIRFQVLFHSPPGVLFAFPSRYWFTIGRLRVFSLGGWSPHLQTGFHVSRPTSLTPSTTESISRTRLRSEERRVGEECASVCVQRDSTRTSST